MKTMRAVKLYRDMSEPDEVKQVKFIPVTDWPVPEIGPGEMLMKMERASICGTDMRILNGTKTKDVRYPSVVGHEMSGTIVELGEGVTNYKVGDRVCVANVCACGKCAMCRIGRSNVCLNRQAIGYEFDGGFEEYVRLPKIAVDNGNIIKMPDHVSFAEGAIIEPLSCCLRGQRNANVKEGDCVVVIGAGPIGLMHTMLAKAAGARKVIVSELSEFRREKALEVGATRVVDGGKEDLGAIVKEETDGVGADVIIMTFGVPKLVNECLKIARKGGSIVLFAGFAKGLTIEIDPNLIHYGELNVTGSSAYKLQDYKDAAEWVFTGKMNLKAIVTHVYKIEQFQEAYEAAKNGAGLKVELEP